MSDQPLYVQLENADPEGVKDLRQATWDMQQAYNSLYDGGHVELANQLATLIEAFQAGLGLPTYDEYVSAPETYPSCAA